MSFITDGASQKLQVVTGSAGSVRIHGSYVNNNAGTITPASLNSGAITTATTTDLYAVPGASNQRRAKVFTVYNDHATVSNLVTIQHTDGTNVVPLWKGTLLAGESIECEANGNFVHYDVGGNPILGGSGRYLQSTLLTTGTTFTTRADTRTIKLKLVGGGGGGGGCSSVASAAAAAGGGGAGGYAEKMFAVNGNTSYTYAIGAAGSNASGAAGGNGGNTTFAVGSTTVTAFGGTGAPLATATVTVPSTFDSGAGGVVSTNGDVNAGGESGVPGSTWSLTVKIAGPGGSSQFGGGGKGIRADGAGVAANGFGGGGGGSATGASTARAGGAPTAGAIIVEEYS